MLLQEEDGADGLLQAERLALLNMKRQLETQLQLTQQQLLVSLSAYVGPASQTVGQF